MANNRRGSVEKPGLDVLGPLQDIIRQMREGKISGDQLQAFAEHRNPFEKKPKETAVIPFQFDKTKDGWILLEDVPFDGNQFAPDVVGFLKSVESSVNGDVMRARAKELKADLGQRHAEYLLNNQHLIPAEYRKYYLVFPGTVWQDRDGDRSVACLDWGGGPWVLDFDWLGGDWNGDGRLVRVRG